MNFTCRSARSGAVLAGILMALAVETLALHLWLSRSHPWLSGSLLAFGIISGAWLLADYRARGKGGIEPGDEALTIRLGLRPPLSVPRAGIARAFTPRWQELPAPDDASYLNLTRPAQPNLLLVLHEPLRIRIAPGIGRRVLQLGLHLDDPAAFLDALQRSAAADAPAPAENRA